MDSPNIITIAISHFWRNIQRKLERQSYNFMTKSKRKYFWIYWLTSFKIPYDSYVCDFAILPCDLSKEENFPIVVIELNPFDEFTDGKPVTILNEAQKGVYFIGYCTRILLWMVLSHLNQQLQARKRLGHLGGGK